MPGGHETKAAVPRLLQDVVSGMDIVDETLPYLLRQSADPQALARMTEAQRRDVELNLRAEIVGDPVDPELDDEEWLPQQAERSHRYVELRYAEAWAALPLQTHLYPDDLAHATALAMVDVLEREPVQVPAPLALYEAQAELKRLPASAPHVVGLCGAARSGKDLAADMLQARYEGVARFAFSDRILAEANAFLASYGHRIDEHNKSLWQYRHLLQAWGMGRRVEDPDYWTRQVSEHVRHLQADGARLVVVTGVRTLTDVQVIQELGGVLWRVERPNNTYQVGGGAAAAIESALRDVPDTAFRVVLNPVEGDLIPYEDNVEAALRAA